MFSTDNINQGWDGCHNGKPQGIGTYAYVIRVMNKDNELIEHGGSVTLVR